MSNCKYAFLNGEIDEEIYIYTQCWRTFFSPLKTRFFAEKKKSFEKERETKRNFRDAETTRTSDVFVLRRSRGGSERERRRRRRRSDDERESKREFQTKIVEGKRDEERRRRGRRRPREEKTEEDERARSEDDVARGKGEGREGRDQTADRERDAEETAGRIESAGRECADGVRQLAKVGREGRHTDERKRETQKARF